MHHTLCRPRTLLLGALLLALVVSGRPEALKAQIPGTSGNALVVPIGGTIPLQLTTKKAISLVKNSKEDVLGIKTVPGDPTRVLLTGQTAGITHLDMTDVDGKVEGFEVSVQLDVEYLRIQLKKLFPTANIEPVPISNEVVVVRGTVNTIADANAIQTSLLSVMPGVHWFYDVRVAGVQQVQLCVTVAEVSRSDLRRMDFNFLTNSKNFFFGSTVGQAVVNPPTIGVGSTLDASFMGQTLAGTVGSPNGAPDNILFGVLHNKWGFLGFLQALRDESVVKALAEPTVTTLSGRPASFLIGGEQAVPVPAGLGQVGVQFEEFGTRLNFVPIVLGNGKIHLEVEPEVSALNAANGTSINGTVVPGRTTDRVNTTVELEDGQTFVIGGLIQHEITGATQKTPILGDLPFLGAAFSSKTFQENEHEVVIMVTPHLVDAEDCSQAPKMLPGDETRRPDDFELFLEGILEAPRGPREVFPNHHYMAAYKNSPTAALFPCAGHNGHGGGPYGGQACGAGDPVIPDEAPAAPMAAAPAPAPAVPAAVINMTPVRAVRPVAAFAPVETAAPPIAVPELPPPPSDFLPGGTSPIGEPR